MMVKGKFVPLPKRQIKKDAGRSRIIDLDTLWRLAVSFTFRLIYLRRKSTFQAV